MRLAELVVGVLFAAAILIAARSEASGEQSEVGKPGYTRADTTLTNDVMKMTNLVLPILTKRATGQDGLEKCKDIQRTDVMITRIGDKPHEWSEDWSFKVCDVNVVMPIDLQPAPNGGTMFALQSKGFRVANGTEQQKEK